MKLHLVVDNYATYNHRTAETWLARNPRITMHLTQTSGSWLDMVEIFFGIIARQAIQSGLTSAKDIIVAIETYIDGWDEPCQPFTWTRTADEVLTKAMSGQSSSRTGRER